MSLFDPAPRHALLGAVAASLLSPAAFAQFVTDPAVSYFVGTQPSGTASADFDGDGDIDIACTVDDPDRVVILLNAGDGSMTLGPTAILPNSSSPGDLRAGDLDGDGDADIAVALQDNAAVIMLINQGGGVFMMGAQASTGENPRGLDIADADNDGDLDLAVANRDSNTATVMLNNGAGSFTSTTLAAGQEPRGAAFADMDNDGDADLAVTNHDDRTVSLYTNNGGSFASSGTLSVGGQVRPEGIAGADLDGDGDEDLAVATNGQNGAINTISVFLSTGAGGAMGPFPYTTGGQDTSTVIAVDLNCDGLMDLVAGNESSGNISMLANLGGATFGAPQLQSIGANPERPDAADLDGDGDADLTVAARDSNSVSVVINQTCIVKQPCIGDVNGDQNVNVVDLVGVITAWGATGSNPADVNGDGVVDVLDLVEVIVNWGACP